MVWVMLSQVDVAHKISADDHFIIVQLLGKLLHRLYDHDFKQDIKTVVRKTTHDLLDCFERTAAATSRHRYYSPVK